MERGVLFVSIWKFGSDGSVVTMIKTEMSDVTLKAIV